MAPRKKSKAKKPTETMRQKQMRLRREALARKAASRKALPPGKKGGPLAKTTKALPAGKTAKALPPGKKGGALSRAVRGVKGVGPNAAVGRLAGRIAVPLGMVSTVAGMRDRSKRDAERNKRLGRKPFQELRDAASSKGNTKRRGQGSRARTGPTISKTKRPMANLPKDYKKTEAAAFKGAQKPKAQTAKARPAAVAGPKKAAAPKKAAPKKVTKKVSGVGPVASGRTYSVKKTGMSVMQQQAAELRKMREASKKRQAADKAKLKKSQSKKKKR